MPIDINKTLEDLQKQIEDSCRLPKELLPYEIVKKTIEETKGVITEELSKGPPYDPDCIVRAMSEKRKHYNKHNQ